MYIKYTVYQEFRGLNVGEIFQLLNYDWNKISEVRLINKE